MTTFEPYSDGAVGRHQFLEDLTSAEAQLRWLEEQARQVRRAFDTTTTATVDFRYLAEKAANAARAAGCLERDLTLIDGRRRATEGRL